MTACFLLQVVSETEKRCGLNERKNDSEKKCLSGKLSLSLDVLRQNDDHDGLYTWKIIYGFQSCIVSSVFIVVLGRAGGIVCQSLDDVEFLHAVVCVLWNKSQYRFGFAMGWW